MDYHCNAIGFVWEEYIVQKVKHAHQRGGYANDNAFSIIRCPVAWGLILPPKYRKTRFLNFELRNLIFWETVCLSCVSYDCPKRWVLMNTFTHCRSTAGRCLPPALDTTFGGKTQMGRFFTSMDTRGSRSFCILLSTKQCFSSEDGDLVGQKESTFERQECALLPVTRV